MDKFQKYKLNIWEKEKILVIEYLDKIKKIVLDNEIDKELYNDIEEMVFEKLSREKKIDQLKVRKIIKEIWEPEVIFSDYVEKQENPKKDEKVIPEDFYKKLIENGWMRDNSWAILLWISQTLAQKIGISIWAVRIFLVLLCFVGGLSVWLYILVGLILPVKGKSYSWKTIFWYFWTQFVYLLRDIVSNITKFFIRTFWRSISAGGNIIKTIGKNTFPILRFFIFLILAFFFAWILLWLLVMWAMYFSRFSIESVDFIGILPNYFIWGIFCWIISSTIFMVTSFCYSLNKKLQSSFFLVFAGVSFLIALFLWISTWFDLVKKYSPRYEFIQDTKQQNVWTWEYLIDISGIQKTGSLWHFSNRVSVKLETSTWDTIEVKVLNKVFGNEEIVQKFKEGINNIILERSENTFSLTFKDNKMFSKKIPFTFLEREIILYVPKGISFTISPYSYYYENVSLNGKYERYQDFLQNNCIQSKVVYETAEQRFVCEINDKELKTAQQEFLKRYIVEDFDKISPLKHKTKYKREYGSEYWFGSDWTFEDISFIDDKTVKIKFSDMSITVVAHLNAEEINGGSQLSNFRIDRVERNDNFEERYYENVNVIKNLINEEE